ncbi:DUF6498-containing protein [Rudaea sp.]|uniref:DUF6498-containing protein n=1 Tax=Rudaea sp. TaxID=2136325 RepID=UPI003220807B
MSARRRDAGRPVAAAPREWIAPPPLAQHLREFAARREAWLILARNLVPVVGIYAFHWSAALAVFNYWFDGLVALAAIVAALVPRALRESQSARSRAAQGRAMTIFKGVLTWAFIVAILGLPYWIVLIPLHDLLLDGELQVQIARSPGLWLTFAMLAGSQFWKAFHFGYDALPENDLKQRVRWDVYLLILRAVAMFMMAAHGLAFVMVPLMALLLSYFEIWPERVLGAVFGDPSRLYEHDPGKD